MVSTAHSKLLLHSIIVTVLVIAAASPSSAQSLPISGVSMTPDQTRQSVQWLADQLMRHVPRTIDGDDNWGDTKKVWAGVKVHRDGWELKTQRRWRELRHGRWIRYEIEIPERIVSHSPTIHSTESATASTSRDNAAALLEPYEASDVVQIHSVTPVLISDGLQSWRADASASTPARFSVRVERWNLGAMWYSIEISGKMNLAMRTNLTLGMSADFAEVPPAMQLDVAIEQASLVVSGFEVERISKLGGDAAEEIGDLAEHTIGKMWLRKENARLVARLNESIADNQDSMRWSMASWLAQLTP